MEPRWTPAFPLARLAAGHARVFKHGGAAVAVFHLANGTFRAVDNRCPHEGYPLVQGTVSGCTLTCQWHNYKFDLRDGACVMGEEGVRSYPVRVVGDMVELDLAPSPTHLAGLWADLHTALTRHEVGRLARGTVRLLDAGVPSVEIALAAARFDAIHAEYGPTHALAFAAELACPPRGAPPRVGELAAPEEVLALTQGLDLAARANVRLPARPVPEPVDPGPDPVAAGERLRALVEAEDGPAAEALVRGAVARGWGRAEIEPWLFRLCADHFLDFGHALIYTTRVFDLLETAATSRAAPAAAPAIDRADAATILGALTYGIVCGTREDLLPGWAGWRARIATLEAGPAPAGALGAEVLVDADVAEAFALVAGAADPLDALSIAASERLLRFDIAIDGDPTVAEGWLDVTHRLTFVHAVRVATARTPPAVARRLQLQAAHFVALARPLDAPAAPTRPPASPLQPTLERILSEVAARSPDAARVSTAAWLSAGGAEAPLLETLERIVLRDHATRAVFLAHHLKTLRAAAAERTATEDDRPLLAAVRFLASPLRERAVERLVTNAIELIRNGRPPRTLTS